MRRALLVLAAFAWVLAASPAAFAAESALSAAAMSPADLVEIDRDRDEEVVTVRGEAIGEALRTMGGGWWVNIMDDDVGVGIWVSEPMLEEIEYFGDYEHTGDVVQVVGPVNIACDEHGGEFDVHAESLQLVERGRPIEHEVVPVRGVIGLVGLGVAFVFWRVFVARRERL
jgi:hypothetical protein